MNSKVLTSTALVAVVLFLGVPAFGVSSCIYSLTNIKVEWTGYKFNEKTGVPGTFKTVTVSQPVKATSADEAIANASFLIDTLSVDSGVELRDESLRESFFKLMEQPYIKGFVESYNPKKLDARVHLNMNGVSGSVLFKIAKTKTEVTAMGKIDVLDYMMNKPLAGINKKCFDLHKGKDGVSKTWSEVGLKITASIAENCKTK